MDNQGRAGGAATHKSVRLLSADHLAGRGPVRPFPYRLLWHHKRRGGVGEHRWVPRASGRHVDNQGRAGGAATHKSVRLLSADHLAGRGPVRPFPYRLLWHHKRRGGVGEHRWVPRASGRHVDNQGRAGGGCCSQECKVCRRRPIGGEGAVEEVYIQVTVAS